MSASTDDASTGGTITVRAVEAGDHDTWATLFRGYRDFYDLEPSDEVVERVWGWLLDASHEEDGLVAVESASGELLGLAHHRPFSRPSAGGTGLFLDDLFTAPQARGRGVGRALIGRLEEIARERGHGIVRWNTAPDNATARRLYDQVAEPKWVSYDLTVRET